MASENTNKDTGTYLYAVVSGLSNTELGSIGLFDSQVYTVAIANDGEQLIAVVSEVPTRDELRPERKHLSAHQRVLRTVIDSSRVVLPVAFGTVADSADGIRSLLTRYRADLSEQMRRIEGKVEMGARAYYKAEKPSVFDFLVAGDPKLAQVRDRVVGPGMLPTRDEKIELGQVFEQVLNGARDEYASVLEKEVEPYCAEVKRTPPRDENDLVRLACLVSRDRQGDFQAALDRSAQALPGEFAVEETGPIPPYDFVDLHLSLTG